MLDVKASLGVAAAQSGSGVGADELVRNADVAMYVSKHGGKGRLSHYDAADGLARRTSTAAGQESGSNRPGARTNVASRLASPDPR